MPDPASAKVVDVRRLGPAPPDPVIAIHPDGTRIAIDGDGQAIVLDLAHEREYYTVAANVRPDPGMRLVCDFVWSGLYLVSFNQLHDLHSPIPLWQFSDTRWSLTDGQSF
ncbi:MAG: hypothetical protein HKN47_25965 [Pirellulaceae bacterium]|nr:hypothetical protein [Pirellulaceae bacterium]